MHATALATANTPRKDVESRAVVVKSNAAVPETSARSATRNSDANLDVSALLLASVRMAFVRHKPL